MYKRILLAVDGSPCADKAIEEAAKLAREGAQLLVVSVASNPAPTFPHPYGINYDVGIMENAVIERTNSIIEAAEQKLKQQGIHPETLMINLTEARSQNVSAAILDEAAEWNADLIIMGTHGRHGLGRLFLGSVAEQTVRCANRPVLLVHNNPASTALNRLNPAEIYCDWPENEKVAREP